MNWKAGLFMPILTAAAGLGAAEYTVPSVKTPPVIDGRIQSGEWDNAFSLAGAGRTIDPRRAEFFMAWDASNLYLAVRSETPPRGKLVVSKGSINIVMDDSVEFWFDPPKELRTVEQAKFGEFQLIASHTGVLYRQHHNPGYGLPARIWTAPGMKSATSIHDGVWEIEFAIPAEAFGLKKLENSDWKILPVRNFRTEPAGQLPFTPVSSFMDSKSYTTFHLRDNAPSIRNTYADDKARLPLRIQIASASTGKYTFETKIGGKTSSRPISGPAGNADIALPEGTGSGEVHAQIRDEKGNILFSRDFHLQPVPERLWFTPESYLVLEQDFEEGADRFICPDKGVTAVSKKMPSIVDGREKGSKAVFFEKGDSILCKGAKLAVPGNVSMWVKTEGSPGKEYRRFFSTNFQSGGYLGLQEHAGYNLLFLHGFRGGNKNLLLNRKPAQGQWAHLSVNIQPGRVEYYFNGVKHGELDLPFELNGSKLGDFVLGGGAGGFTLDGYAVYSRILTPEEIKVLAQGESKLTGELGWYPSLQSFVVDVTGNPARLQTDSLLLKVTDTSGKVLFSRPAFLKNGFRLGEGEKQMIVLHEKAALDKPLPDGRYFLSLSIPETEEVLLEKAFLVKKYDWLGNTLGKADRILPPFTPLQVKGDTLSCILRDYKIGSNGLPSEVVTLGKQILAGPVTLNFVRGKQATALRGKGKAAIRKLSDTAVEYKADSEQGVEVKGRLEQDGLLRLDLRFPETLEADRVYMDIPVQKEFAVLFHAVGEHIRANPAGFVPEGKGTIFKSRSVQQIHVSNFIPYIWVGTDDRGICYAADWDRGWVHTKDRDAVELFRHSNGDVSIRLNLLNAPFQIKKGHTVTLALMASPVKPMPEGWRGWSDGYGFKGNRVSRVLASPPYWGSYTCWTAHYPAFMDFGYVRKLAETRDTGVIDNAYIQAWLSRLEAASKEEVPLLRAKDPLAARQYSSGHTNSAFATARSLFPYRRNSVLYYYTCDSDGAQALAEYPAFRDEWNNGVGVYGSYQDYAIYYLDRMLEAGMTGVYDDNTFFRCNYSWAAGNAYIDDNGTVQPSFGLWNNREYRRRQLGVLADRKLNPWITVHQTNANILPTLGFATNSMGMEWKYGVHDFQERFTPDYIRAVSQGLQGGFFPTVLDGITGGTKEQRAWATRTMLASLLPHEIRPTIPRGADAQLLGKIHSLLFDFGTWKDDCVYTAYWNASNPVKSADPKLLVSTYRRGRELMIVCGSYTGDMEAVLTLEGKVKSAKNAETDAPVSAQGNRIVFPLKKHDFALIRAELE
ncbi:MAG: hypothetical protein BWY31_03050 [Lentisphaerae bacterium ADurb.Bin242]|nr:MAG: hypothetical protein BWY31_03050 [Lentisphaerae bacterium ADurb.Bin242]